MGFDRWFLHGCCLEVVVRLLQKLETFLFCSLVQILLFCLIYSALKLRIISIIEYFLLLQKQKNFSFPYVLQCKIFQCGKCTRSNLLENTNLTNLKIFHKHTSFINIIMGRYLKIHFGKAEMFHLNRRKTFNSKRVKMSYFNFNKISYNVWMKRKENTVWKHFDLSDEKHFLYSWNEEHFNRKFGGFLFSSKFRMKQNFKIVIYPVTFLCFEQF